MNPSPPPHTPNSPGLVLQLPPHRPRALASPPRTPCPRILLLPNLGLPLLPGLVSYSSCFLFPLAFGFSCSSSYLSLSPHLHDLLLGFLMILGILLLLGFFGMGGLQTMPARANQQPTWHEALLVEGLNDGDDGLHCSHWQVEEK